MNKFEIHVLLAGFSTDEHQELLKMLSVLPINLHRCNLDAAIFKLPKVHVLLIGTNNINNAQMLPNLIEQAEESEQVIQEPTDVANAEMLSSFVTELKQASPYCMAYLLAPADKILSLTDNQQAIYRDFIIYPVNHVFLKKRLFRIINDLQDKFVQLVKKRQLKKRLEDSDHESLQFKVSLDNASQSTREANRHLLRMLSNQVFARMGQRASGRNQQLNLLLTEIAKACELSGQEIQDLTNAWHLRNIGKMGFSDKILHTAYIELSIVEQRVFNCHPTLSHAAMMVVRSLDKASKIVLQHKEYMDGSGYPHGIIAEKISRQSQILTVLTDYTELVAGRYMQRMFSTVEALAYLENYASEKYSESVVAHLIRILPELSKNGQGLHDLVVPSSALQIGMQMSRDLISSGGILLLSEKQIMDKETIERLRDMEENLQEHFKIFINQK